MVIVDASVWIDWDRRVMNPQTLWMRHAVQSELGLTDLIMCEVLRGCRDEQHAAYVSARLLRTTVLGSGGATTAQDAARYYRLLRETGITVASTVNCITAAFCLRNGHQLLHRDHVYDAFEKHFGLAVIHPGGGQA